MSDDSIFSVDMEQAVINIALSNPEALKQIDLLPEWFFIVRHQDIVRAMRSIKRSGASVDLMTVSEQLNTTGKLAEIGGPAYLMKIMSGYGYINSYESYINILKDKSRRRSLKQLGEVMANAAFDLNSDLDNLTPEWMNWLTNAVDIKHGAIPLADVMSRLYDDVDVKSDNPVDIWGVPTGFGDFDALTGGLQPGEMFLLSGEPGVGKSMWAMQAATQMGKKSPGGIYSMEMNDLSVARRLVSGEGQIPARNIKTGRLAEDEWTLFTHCIEMFSALPVYISDAVGWNITTLRADLARLKAQYNIQWFCLDYLYLLNEGPDEIERTQRAATGLKNICRELKIAGLVVHSMNKAGIGGANTSKDEPPSNDKLRGSGQVIYDADLVAFLTKYKPVKGDPIPADDQANMRMLWFGKGRELEQDKKYLRYVKNPGYPSFKEYTTRRLP